MRDEITVMLLTFDEALNLERTLRQLTWAKRVVVVDNFSTDASTEMTMSILPQAQIFEHAFVSFADQCNFGLRQITTEWVLSLDADYILSPTLIAEINALAPPANVSGYSARFRYCVFGHALRTSLYPARVVLYRRQSAHYHDEGHGHRVIVDGKIDMLEGEIDHDDRKPLGRWLSAQDRYATVEARHLLEIGKSNAERQKLGLQDRLRLKMFFAAPAVFLYLLFGRGLIFDGWPGWVYVAQRTIAELILSIRLLSEKHELDRSGRIN